MPIAWPWCSCEEQRSAGRKQGHNPVHRFGPPCLWRGGLFVLCRLHWMRARGFLPRLNDAGKESVGPDGWIDGSWPRVLAGLLFRLKSLPSLRSTTSCSSEIRVEMLKKISGQLTTGEHITLYQKRHVCITHNTSARQDDSVVETLRCFGTVGHTNSWMLG